MGFTTTPRLRVRQVALIAALAILLASAIGGVIALAGFHEHERALATMAPRMVSSAQVRAAALLGEIEGLRNDVLFLREVPPVAGLVRAAQGGGVDHAEQTSAALWRSRFHTILSAFMQSNREIRQIALLGVAPPAAPLGGVRRGMDGMVDWQVDALSTPAFDEALAAARGVRTGQAWVSPLKPAASALYAATPVFDQQGRHVATLVVEYDLAPALARLRTALSREFVLFLLDAQGRDLLAGPMSAADNWDQTHAALPAKGGEPAALARVVGANGILYVRTVALNLGQSGAAPRLPSISSAT